MIRRWKIFKRWFSNLPILKQILDWSKVYSLPGFSGVPIYNIIVFIYNETMRDNITTRANSVAFSLFLAIFPFIIFLFTLLPYLFDPEDFSSLLTNILPSSSGYPSSDSYIDILEEYLASVLPTNANQYLLGIIDGIVGIKRDGLLSLGFFLAMFFASSGMLTIMYGFDKSYKESFKTRSYMKKRVVAVSLTMLLSILFIASFFLLIIGNVILAYISEKLGLAESSVWIISFIKSIAAIMLLYTGITIIYKYGPSLRKRIPFINPGSILATLLSILTSFAFSYFINNFGRYNELYGSIGALIVIMLWLQFNAFVILIGYELMASIAVNRDLINYESE
ncbi:MAG: YihY/virulence factor BrkB family protein [Saprospiraceae bacterium]|nr:YihY/virulence factor BrkB family protein [Saprospiraceae bacterium]